MVANNEMAKELLETVLECKADLTKPASKRIEEIINGVSNEKIDKEALYIYGSFRELFEDISPERCGNSADNSVEELVARMRNYYSETDEEIFGVLGIKIELTSLSETRKEQEEIAEAMFDRYFPDGMK